METEAILTFGSTHHAIAAERALLDAGLPVKVMNLPSAIKAGCGICLRLPPPQLGQAAELLAGKRITTGGAWLCHTQNHHTRYTPVNIEPAEDEHGE